MCKTTTVTHTCGHWHRTSHKLCEAAKKPLRNCFASFFGFSKPCRKTHSNDKSPVMCFECLRTTPRNVKDIRSIHQQRKSQDQHTLSFMEGMDRSRVREEAERGRARQKSHGVRNPAPAVKVNRPPPVASRSSGDIGWPLPEANKSSPYSKKEKKIQSERKGRTQQEVLQAQRRIRREREMRHAHRLIPSAQDFLAAESKVKESRGIDWNSKLGQSRQPQPWAQHLPAQAAGFSSDGYKAYWDGIRAKSSVVSAIGQDDYDFVKYPIVAIPEHDEYPQYSI